MNLNTQQNIDLCRKALLTKELQYYSKLCELYSRLANMQKGVISAEILQKKYASALTKAASGDLEFTKPENNVILLDDLSGKKEQRFSDTEIAVFKEYAFSANRLRQFQTGCNILSQAIVEDRQGRRSLDTSAIDEFHDYMQETSKSTRSFDDYINVHSRQGVGHNYFLAARQAIKKINSIDSQHLPIDKFIKDITPLAFGSTINSVKSHNRIIDEASSIYSKNEANEFRDKPNFVKETAYKINKKASKVYTANKAKARGVMVGAACIALLLGGASYINDANSFKDLNVRTNSEQGYQTYVSQETIDKLASIRNSIETAENSTVQPSAEELADIADNLDNVIDDVMTDLVTDAFETRNPDCKVVSVETKYDRTVNMNKGSNSEPEPEEFCTITYTNEDGKEKNITVSEFSSFAPLMTGNTIIQSYTDEEKLDNLSPNVDTNQNFIKQGEDVMSILSKYKTILENTEHLAGTQMVYSGGVLIIDPSLKTVLPEKTKNSKNQRDSVSDTKVATTRQDIDDDLEIG